MSNVFTLLFAPTFLILIRFFEFKSVVLSYILLSFALAVYTYLKARFSTLFYLLAIYFSLLVAAYFSGSFEVVKYIPVIVSFGVFNLFLLSHLNKKELILTLTKRFYKKELSSFEVEYLKRGDIFWAVAIFIYMVFQIFLVYSENEFLWAFFNSIGWYIYFAFVLVSQIVYGRFYAHRVHSK